MELVAGGICAPRAVQASGVQCGIKERGMDLALIYLEQPATVAGTFTTNQMAAAPVLVTRQRVAQEQAQAVVANSGNANSCTGKLGLANAEKMAEIAGRELGLSPSSVLVASTGVIGQQLPMERVEQGIAQAARLLSPDGGPDAARAIMTTDTVPKEIAVEVDLGDRSVKIGGIAKGAGMICPQMATMFCFLTTDAVVSAQDLSAILPKAVDQSFNCITVDGDTSTNDMVLIFANGAVGGEPLSGNELKRFQAALDFVTQELAVKIASDGEGSTKLVTITVRGAKRRAEAHKVAMAIANSPLVKTAIFGEDANFGRVLAAAGKAGVELDPDRVCLSLDGIELVRNGLPLEFDAQSARQEMAKSVIQLDLDLGLGRQSATVWTCDLTADYVRINARYHT